MNDRELQWTLQVTYLPGFRGTTHPLVDTVYHGRDEQLARAHFETYSNPLSHPYAMEVELLHGRRRAKFWEERTALSDRQRGLRDAMMAAERTAAQKRDLAGQLGTAAAYGEERNAERAYHLAQRAFDEAMFLSPHEYEVELAIRARYADRRDPAGKGLHGHPEIATGGGGNIFWRGVYVDTFFEPLKMDVEAHELAAHCHHLEAIGVPVNARTYCHHFNWFRVMGVAHPFKSLLSHHLTCSFWHRPATGELALVGVWEVPGASVLYYDGGVWHRLWWQRADDDYAGGGAWEYHGLVFRGWRLVCVDPQEKHFLHLASLEEVVGWLAAHSIAPDFLDEEAGGPWCRRGAECQWCRTALLQQQAPGA
jgi:hypothetical protein